jgi:hypothetical protein
MKKQLSVMFALSSVLLVAPAIAADKHLNDNMAMTVEQQSPPQGLASFRALSKVAPEKRGMTPMTDRELAAVEGGMMYPPSAYYWAAWIGRVSAAADSWR